MSCRLYINTNFIAWATATSYPEGAIRQHLSATFFCLGGNNADEEPHESENWISTRDIEYNIIHETWAASDLKTYNRWDVVEHDLGGGLKLYVSVVTHDNASASQSLDQDAYWQEIEIACLLKETYNGSKAEYVDTLILERGDVVEHNELPYAFIDNSFTPLTEEPGTYTSINNGQQFENIDGLTNTDIDLEADDSPTVWSKDSSYNKNVKVLDFGGYYVSRIDNNVGNSPSTSDTWVFAHPYEAELINPSPDEWAAGTYSWGAEVSKDGFTYTSSIYQNTTTPGTDELDWRTIGPLPISNCFGITPIPYNPNTPYSKQDVVISQGTSYQSLIDYNLTPLTNSDSWILCTDLISPDCSLNSLGPWNPLPFYLVSQTVEHLGNYYIVKAQNSNKEPNTHPRYWTLCKAGISTCDSESFGPYNPTTTYNENSVVEHDYSKWISTTNGNLGNTPSASSTFWKLCKQLEYPKGTVSESLYETLIYSEAIKFFDAFVDFNSCMYMRVNGKVYSFDNTQDLWIHEGGEHGSYHGGSPEKMKIVVVVNETISLRTVYDSIMCYSDTNNIKFDKVSVRTNFVQSQDIFKSDDRYRVREGVHTMPARGYRNNDRLRGNWLEITYEITGQSGQDYEFTYITSDYLKRQSMRP